MNQLNVLFPLLSLLAFLFVAVPAEVVGQITAFQNGFEYNEEPIIFEPMDLNGAAHREKPIETQRGLGPQPNGSLALPKTC